MSCMLSYLINAGNVDDLTKCTAWSWVWKGTGGCQSCVPSNCNLLEALHIISDLKLYM